MAKRLPCEKCKKFIPHFHPERFKKIPKSGFVFVGDMGDLWWAAYASQGPEYHLLLDELLDLITKTLREAKKAHRPLAFFFETKAPEVYSHYWFDDWSEYEVWASVTIETNRAELTRRFSKAPDPEKRFRDMYNLALDWPLTHISIEPIMDFDLDVMLDWIERIEPMKVSVGYDNYGNRLPEPPLSKTLELIRHLREMVPEVEIKTLRKAWNEK